MKDFLNPYEADPEAYQTSIKVSAREVAKLQAMHASRGTLQKTTGILFSKFMDALEPHLTPYAPEKYEQLVLSATVTIAEPPRQSSPKLKRKRPPSPKQAPSGDEPTGA